ncbi:MAG: copper chaperone PCu(A)C [Pseudomonadota bacterium]|nr:copper chaperone PCu(A)C [Pseudomonadota bacterium]MEE3071246.1 copper chaperone PCu(A)C [Pseudomonadota bacterium]
MSFKLIAAAMATVCALPLSATAEMEIDGAYARSSMATSKSGAAFMEIHNTSTEDDTLIGARSDAAKVVELHTHIDAGNGVMQMREDEDGFPIPAGGTHALQRGGDHVMFMGLNAPFEDGQTIHVTLVFEKAGEVEIDIPVKLDTPMGGQMKHDDMKHGDMDHGQMQHGKAAN